MGFPWCPPIPRRVPPFGVPPSSTRCRNSPWPLASRLPRNEEGPKRPGNPSPMPMWVDPVILWFPAPSQVDPGVWGPPLNGSQTLLAWVDLGLWADPP